MDYHCGQCGRPVNTAGHCPSCTFDRTGADVEPSPRDTFNLAVANRVRIEDLEKRLARVEAEAVAANARIDHEQRERLILENMLTELRRELALNRQQYDAAKPLPGTCPPEVRT